MYKALMSPEVIKKLTGLSSQYKMQLWDLGSDEDGVWFQFTRDRQGDVPDDSKEFFLKIKTILEGLPLHRGGRSKVIVLSESGEPVIKEGRTKAAKRD